MIRATGYMMTCDGDEECASVIYGASRKEAIANSKTQGWTFKNGTGRQYCVAHTAASQCKDCGRYMRPWGRNEGQFPADWVATGHSGYCGTCVGASTGNNVSPATEQLERAVAQYMETFPSLKEFVEEVVIEDQEAYARRTLARYGANDLEEAVFG